jgi:1-aminocyclopropane-1-carboxylate deaminase/D-cysteine desulfhydrase-like pyridoxal-dependent ACC family enzyme
MAETEKPSREMQEDLLKFAQAKYKSAQDKYNAIQALAKKYNMPLEKMIKNIIMEWMIDDKNQKFTDAGKKAPFKKIL